MKTLAIIGAVLTSGLAWGQVTVTQDGRALDANYGIGSGGYNSIRQSNRAFDANLYVTGQTSGGFFNFHGTSPYSAANQLGIPVPSAGLDTFIRQSVGVQYASNPYYGPRPYYNPSQTVVGPADIARGANAPGTSIPRTAFVPPTAVNQLSNYYQNSIQAYQPLMPNLADRTESMRSMLQSGTGPVIAGAAPPERAPAGGGSASALFGVVRLAEQQRLAEELADTAEGGGIRPIQPIPAENQGKPFQPQDRQLPGKQPSPRQPARQPPPMDVREVNGMPQLGQDVFLDMLIQLNQMRQAQQPAEAPRRAEPARRYGLTEQEQEELEARARRAGPPAVEGSLQQLTLHSLAGASRDMFNLHMAKAEALLRQGKFYEAASQYEVAGILNRDNPLAWLGQAVALLGANEPVSAAYGLREAMRRFPPMMETRVDLARLLGKDVLNARIVELETRIAQAGDKPEATLVFLAAFVRNSMDNPATAAALARQLRAAGADDALYQAYAEYLITGRRPATTQPVRPAALPK